MATADLNRIPAFYHRYVKRVSEASPEQAFLQHQTELAGELMKIPEDRWDYRYAEGKWSVKELVQHVIDAERIFCYRALRFARNDQTELPGFDENLYTEFSNAGHRTKASLLEELATVQKSSAQLVSSFSPEQLQREGIANGERVYVAGIGYIIIGHALHHKAVLMERYL
ncbi:MAG TPA: DinB family protein [Flavisolibacter sp.]|nr:DinB family protein [Flavisolibacter sp.]